jgi:hypothetical protein
MIPARGTTTITTAANTGADEVALVANPARLRVIISNRSAANPLYINFGAAAGAAVGFTLAVGAYWDSGNGPVPVDDIHVFGTLGQTRSIMEI